MKREHSPDEPPEAKSARCATAVGPVAQTARERKRQASSTHANSSLTGPFLSPFRLSSWRRGGAEPASTQPKETRVADATVTTSVVVRHSSDRQAPSERPAGRDWDRFDAYHTAPRLASGHGGWREGPAGPPAPRAGPPKKKPWWFFANRQRHEPRPPPPPPCLPPFNQSLVEPTAERYLHAVKANKMLEGGGPAPPVMSSNTRGAPPMRWSFGPPVSLQPAALKYPAPPFQVNGWEPRLPFWEIPPWRAHTTPAHDADARVIDLETQLFKLEEQANEERSILKKQIHQLQTERDECRICGRCETDLDLPLKQRFDLIKNQKMNLEKNLSAKNQTIQQQNRRFQSLQDQLNNWKKRGESGQVEVLNKELAELKKGIDKLARTGKAT